jgi:two-component system, response regulator PdtaR
MSHLVEETASDFASKIILIVEDEAALRFVIATVLREDGGFSVVEAHTADEALLYLRSGNPVDLVFTDVRMPGTIDGVRLSLLVREEFPHVGIMMTSGNLLQHERLDGVPLVVKPYDLEQVLTQITSALNSNVARS